MTATPDPGDVVAAYLVDYAGRQARTKNRLPFRTPVENALTGLLYLRVLEHLSAPIPRAAAGKELARVTDQVPAGREANAAANVAGYVWAALRVPPDGDVQASRISSALEAGRRAPVLRNLAGMAWRMAFLAAARPHLDPAHQTATDADLKELIPKVARAAGRDSRARTLEVHAQATLALSLTSLHLEAEELQANAAQAIARLADTVKLDGAAGAVDSVPTRALACLGVAADSAGDASVASVIARQLLTRVVSEDRGALVGRGAGDDRPELRPWVPMALVGQMTDGRAAEAVLDPKAHPLPTFSVSAADGGADRLTYTVELAGRSARRSFDTGDLNLLVDRVVTQLGAADPAQTTARQHGHLAASFMVAFGRTDDEPTHAALEALVTTSMKEIVTRQHANGGWPYGHKTVKSVSYTAGGATSRQFADLEYTIDAAVPGIALAMAHRTYGTEEYLQAADRAFAFFEQVIGRVEHEGRRIWRLWPEDAKTIRMGTAVNYELWNACFFAAYAQVTPDAGVRARALGYVHDAVDYAEGLTSPEGDIAYGDYVRERRTAYASWDAVLLAAIGHATGSERAMRLSRLIVERLATVLLPSGAMPNVVDHLEQVGEHTRLSVHRHGIGPHPVRVYYQLYFVVATVLAGRARDAGSKALGFVLLDLCDPTTATLKPGYAGDGEPAPAREALPSRDWLLLSLSLLGDLGAMRYRPARGPVHSAGERLARTAAEVHQELRERAGPGRGGESTSTALGCALLARATGVRAWTDAAVARAREIADLPPDGQPRGAATRLMLAVHEASADDHLVESARGWAADAAQIALDFSSTADALDAAAAVVSGQRPEVVDAVAAERLAESLLAGQDRAGWWLDSETPAAAPQAQVLTALLRYHRSRPAGASKIERAVFRGARVAWKELFEPTGRTSMDVGDAARFAWIFGRIAEWPEREAYERYAQSALRQFLHTHRTATGGLAPPPGSDGRRAVAAAFLVLAELAEERPGWLE